jgi:hypothetical protein
VTSASTAAPQTSSPPGTTTPNVVPARHAHFHLQVHG